MTLTERIETLCRRLDAERIEYRREEPLSRHTTFRIGGAIWVKKVV